MKVLSDASVKRASNAVVELWMTQGPITFMIGVFTFQTALAHAKKHGGGRSFGIKFYSDGAWYDWSQCDS